ncbi:MAG: tandem-95 repeat protein [Ilumatobacteraceae bacterium]|nr:tandem-95 repeat protein [Ilumatobacteraceae bacterium]
MKLSTVSWRKAVAAIAATVLGLLAVMIMAQSEGIAAVDAASSRATHWFVHQPSGRIVLVDGYGGRALASLDAGARGDELTAVEGGPGAFVLNETTAEARAIDSAELSLGPPLGLTTLGDGRAVAAVGQSGLVVVNRADDEATVVPAGGEPSGFSVVTGTAMAIAPDGAVWSLVNGDLLHRTPTSSTTTALGVDDAELSLVGNEPLVVDRANRRARLGDGSWQLLPTQADPSEIIVQQQGPSNECGWVGANDELWCVSRNGLEQTATIDGLDIDGSDVLAIAGDAAVVVKRGPSSIVRFDWREEEILEDLPASVPSDASLQVIATVDLIWVDDSAGEIVWAINPWSIEAIDKNDRGILVLGEEGDVVDPGDSPDATTSGADDSAASEPEVREPDDNGVDDPPVAVDDHVTARSGSGVPVQVTANDYDPDGEAIAVASVEPAGHGTVDIGTASTVVYTPDPGYVGLDQFDYKIVDGNGTEASASVVLELLAPDSTNKSPVGIEDHSHTGAGVPVIVEVLLNDVDPERDSLRIGSFSPPEGVGETVLGEVTETVGPSGLAALRFAPSEGFEGTAIFSYHPVDALDAVGEAVEVRVEVAHAGDENRPPVARPEAIRLRPNLTTSLPVLVNDDDPDGDPLTLSVIEPLPDGLSVEAEGQQLAVTVRAGAAALVPFEYEIDDGNGHQVRGSVLVDVIDDIEPNRPPVVSADAEKAVVGKSVVIDVTANDVDPDGDPLVVVDVSQPDGDRGDAVVFSRSQIQFSPSPLADDTDEVNARFTYTVSDGRGHEVVGEITVTVLPEALPEPPFARDDSTFTFVDVPVTVDVLHNDGDPSGGRPSLVGTPGCLSGGRAIVTADGQVRFDPPRGLSGAFSCTYEVTNDRGLRAGASIIVSVREPELTNQPPDVVDDTLTVEVGETASIDVTANDSDPDGDDDDLEVVSSTAPLLGAAERNGNTIVFTADQLTGVSSIDYQVVDSEGAVSLGRLLIRVIEKANIPPIAVADVKTIFGPGSPQQFAVLDNDSDPDETPGGLELVSASVVSGNGTVSVSGSIVIISPDPGFVGEIVAEYTISDGGGLTTDSLVVLKIDEPLNRPPDARDDNTEVVNGGTVTSSILFNDVDPDGDSLVVSLVGGPDPGIGSASLGIDQSVIFTALPGASGTATINYQVSDGELIDSAALRITVHPCSESTPVASDAFLETGYQQSIAVDLNSYGLNGNIVEVVGPAGFDAGVYSPPAGENGNVAITYAVVNSCRLRASGTVTIDVNQDPIVSPKSVNVSRGGSLEVHVSDLATDSEPLTISASPAAPAWVTTEASRLVISPPEGTAVGSYSWTSTVVDPGGLTGSVPITATIVNAVPLANPDSVDVSDGSAASFDVLDNDTDPDGPHNQLRVRVVPATITFTNGETGTVVISPSGREITIDPQGGLGTAQFEYTIEDDDGGVSAAASISVVGPRLNTPPFANNQSVAVVAGVATPLSLDAGDADGDPISVINLVDPSGVVTNVSGMTATIMAPVPGTYTFTYQVEDADDPSGVATVTIDASPPTTTTTTTTTTSPP